MSSSTKANNASDLLARFRDRKNQNNELRVEISAIPGACFAYHPEGCEQCVNYLAHLLEDIEKRPSRYSFDQKAVLDSVNDAWPQILSGLVTEDRQALIKELGDKESENSQLLDEIANLHTELQDAKAQIESLQRTPGGCERLLPTVSTNADVSNVSVESLREHDIVSPPRKRRRELDDSDFINKVRKPEERLGPAHWSLPMCYTITDWHTNQMSIPNAVREDSDGYFLEEDIDVASWLSELTAQIHSRGTVMQRMKDIFGSPINFATAFSEFDPDSLVPNHLQPKWLTDIVTPIRLDSQIRKGIPLGPDFLALVLKHSALSKEQIYEKIIPYMERDARKKPCSATAKSALTTCTLTKEPGLRARDQ